MTIRACGVAAYVVAAALDLRPQRGVARDVLAPRMDYGRQIGCGSQSPIGALEPGPRGLAPSYPVRGRVVVEFTTERGFERRLLAGQVGLEADRLLAALTDQLELATNVVSFHATRISAHLSYRVSSRM